MSTIVFDVSLDQREVEKFNSPKYKGDVIVGADFRHDENIPRPLQQLEWKFMCRIRRNRCWGKDIKKLEVYERGQMIASRKLDRLDTCAPVEYRLSVKRPYLDRRDKILVRIVAEKPQDHYRAEQDEIRL